MRTARLTGCQQCQRLRGPAAPAKRRQARLELQRIRDAWGDHDDPTAVPFISTTAGVVGSLEDEDF
jgi:hypothetical protein